MDDDLTFPLVDVDPAKAVRAFYAAAEEEMVKRKKMEKRKAAKLKTTASNPLTAVPQAESLDKKPNRPRHLVRRKKTVVERAQERLAELQLKQQAAGVASSMAEEELRWAARVVGRATTAPLRRTVLQFYLMILDASEGPFQPVARNPNFQELAVRPVCPNCGADINGSNLFCSELCQQEAITVRYCRRVVRDGDRCVKIDVQEGIGIRIMMLFGGGYPAKKRSMSPELRKEIMERDLYQCRLCGQPATEIDHIHDSSNAPMNLRAVCKSCNLSMAVNRAKTVTMDSDPELFLKIRTYLKGLAARVAEPWPLKVCDDEMHWQAIQYHIRAARKYKDHDEVASSD